MSYNKVIKIIQYFIFVITGVFLEFWIFTFSQILSIRDWLFNQNVIWGRFFTLMIIGNLFLIGFFYVVTNLTERLLKLKTNLRLIIVLIWIVAFVVTFFLLFQITLIYLVIFFNKIGSNSVHSSQQKP